MCFDISLDLAFLALLLWDLVSQAPSYPPRLKRGDMTDLGPSPFFACPALSLVNLVTVGLRAEYII